MIAAFTPDDDPDPVDRSRACDLGAYGLPGHGVAIAIGADGEEHYVVLQYDAGSCEYWPADWMTVAPHEVIVNGLPIYRKD